MMNITKIVTETKEEVKYIKLKANSPITFNTADYRNEMVIFVAQAENAIIVKDYEEQFSDINKVQSLIISKDVITFEDIAITDFKFNDYELVINPTNKALSYTKNKTVTIETSVEIEVSDSVYTISDANEYQQFVVIAITNDQYVLQNTSKEFVIIDRLTEKREFIAL